MNSPPPPPPSCNLPADPTPLDQLLAALAASGLTVFQPDLVPLFELFRTTSLRYLVQKMPCPKTWDMNPSPVTAGQGYTFNFSNAQVPFHYSITVIKVATAGDTVVFQETKLFNGPPFNFAIPAVNAVTGTNTFEMGAEYLFVLQPTLMLGGVEVAFGCVQSLFKTASAIVAHELVSAALALWASKDC